MNLGAILVLNLKRVVMSAIIFRTATSADLPEMTRLWHEKIVIQQQFDRRFTLLPDGAARWSSAVEEWLSDDDWALFVAERENVLLGYIVGRMKPSPPGLMPETTGLITDLTVDAHSHESGIGKTLLAALREWFSGHGITHLIAYVPARQTVEQAFWRSQGAAEWVDLMWMKI
jgi:ribosomal protein S18 acetylase RimI-like enzyme